jgi:hypothetical protein
MRTTPHAFGVDDTLHTKWQHSVALGGSITLHWVAELIAFSTLAMFSSVRAERKSTGAV